MLSLRGISVVLAIFMVNFCDNCVSLGFHDKGVCEVYSKDLHLKGTLYPHYFKHLVCCDNYEYDSELDQCDPICNLRCANGQCVEPNTCKCNDGFKTDPNNAFNCIPICEPECVHGYCAAPNECKCNIGYVEIENRTVCKPVCVGCEFGQCVEPNNCACFEGYERTNFTCKPRCSSCSNGDCVAPETCRYSLDNNPTQSPYTICNKGYDLVCSVICNHGYCTPPRNCTCKPKKKGAIFNL